MNKKPECTFILADFLPYRLSVVSNRVSRGLATIYQDMFDLTVAEWRVIAVLGSDSAMSAKDITEITIMDKVTVSRAVQRLIEAGHLSACPDAQDRRRQVLTLTKTGLDVFEAVVPLALAYEERLSQRLDDEERQELTRLLDKIGAV